MVFFPISVKHSVKPACPAELVTMAITQGSLIAQSVGEVRQIVSARLAASSVPNVCMMTNKQPDKQTPKKSRRKKKDG